MSTSMPPSLHPWLSSIDEIIEDARQGKMFILADAENRENEGDLVIVAEKANAEHINFMARFGRGLICLALTQERVKELRLPLMNPQNEASFKTAFTVSIEAKEGVTTGISAQDRAHTIAVAIDPTKTASDVTSPGHVFPLMARDAGVLTRPGHTEAAVDIARLAGCNPSGVICEIMNDDGTMARMPDLIAFAQKHGFKIATVEALIQYRQAQDNWIVPIGNKELKTKELGTWHLHFFKEAFGDGHIHMAAMLGKPPKKNPLLTRIQPLTSDISQIDFQLDALEDLLDLDEDEIPVDLVLWLGSMAFLAKHKPGLIICPSRPQPTPTMRVIPPISQENLTVTAQILKLLEITAISPLLHPKENPWNLSDYGIATHPSKSLDME